MSHTLRKFDRNIICMSGVTSSGEGLDIEFFFSSMGTHGRIKSGQIEMGV